MKVCFPIKSNKGVDSIPCKHFGVSPMFIMCDLDTDEIRAIGNDEMSHQHGRCKPLKTLKSECVDIVIVKEIALGAIVKLRSLGIKAFMAEDCGIEENLELFKKGKLMEFSSEYFMQYEYDNDGYQIS